MNRNKSVNYKKVENKKTQFSGIKKYSKSKSSNGIADVHKREQQQQTKQQTRNMLVYKVLAKRRKVFFFHNFFFVHLTLLFTGFFFVFFSCRIFLRTIFFSLSLTFLLIFSKYYSEQQLRPF